MLKNFSFVLSSLFVVACAADSDHDSTTEVRGSMTYRDASTDHSGQAHEAAAPPAQAAELEIVVKGTGQIPELDPQCSLDPAGAFQAHYAGSFELDDDGAYLAMLGQGSATLTTPSGCEIPELTVGVITDVVVRAHIEATTQNCDTYCTAHARAEAEQSCGVTEAAASCRADAESQLAAQCTTTCTTEAEHITAEVSLAAAVLGELDAAALRGAVLGELEANLVFEHLTDAQGERL